MASTLAKPMSLSSHAPFTTTITGFEITIHLIPKSFIHKPSLCPLSSQSSIHISSCPSARHQKIINVSNRRYGRIDLKIESPALKCAIFATAHFRVHRMTCYFIWLPLLLSKCTLRQTAKRIFSPLRPSQSMIVRPACFLENIAKYIIINI